jgi:hypothetical protein
MSNRLAEILSKSKAVMQKTEENHGSTNMNSGGGNMFSSQEKEIPNLTENYINNNRKTSTNSVAPQNGRYRNLEKSKMPDFIKQAMIENPIDIPETPYHTFELEDVAELVNESVPTQQPMTQKTPKNVDVNNIRQIVREEIEDVVRSVVEEYLDKSLVTEDIKIKIGDTIFGGTLKPLPNKKRK